MHVDGGLGGAWGASGGAVLRFQGCAFLSSVGMNVILQTLQLLHSRHFTEAFLTLNYVCSSACQAPRDSETPTPRPSPLCGLLPGPWFSLSRGARLEDLVTRQL